MASMQWKGDVEMQVALANAEEKLPNIIQEMLKNAAQLILFELKMVNWTFQKYWKANKAKKNKWGWFVSIVLKGKTSSGAPVALAANVSEYGRQGYHPQPARPFIRKTLQELEPDVESVMQNTFDRAMKEVMRV
jgi:HK97 gp10 family phage protein